MWIILMRYSKGDTVQHVQRRRFAPLWRLPRKPVAIRFHILNLYP